MDYPFTCAFSFPAIHLCARMRRSSHRIWTFIFDTLQPWYALGSQTHLPQPRNLDPFPLASPQNPICGKWGKWWRKLTQCSQLTSTFRKITAPIVVKAWYMISPIHLRMFLCTNSAYWKSSPPTVPEYVYFPPPCALDSLVSTPSTTPLNSHTQYQRKAKHHHHQSTTRNRIPPCSTQAPQQSRACKSSSERNSTPA